MHTLFREIGSTEFVEEKEFIDLVKEEENFDLVSKENEIIVGKFVGSDFLQGEGKMFDLIDMDFIEVEKYFAIKEFIDSVNFFFTDYDSKVSELFGISDHFSKKEIYDFVFLGTYIW